MDEHLTEKWSKGYEKRKDLCHKKVERRDHQREEKPIVSTTSEKSRWRRTKKRLLVEEIKRLLLSELIREG